MKRELNTYPALFPNGLYRLKNSGEREVFVDRVAGDSPKLVDTKVRNHRKIWERYLETLRQSPQDKMFSILQQIEQVNGHPVRIAQRATVTGKDKSTILYLTTEPIDLLANFTKNLKQAE